MRTKLQANGTKVKDKSFKSILEQMMKITTGGNLRVANQNWDIFQKSNNINYNNSIGVSR